MALSIDQKRLKATKFPPEFDKKVDIEKVNIDLMKKWIANKITTILGDEDDIVVETCYNLIEQNQFPKIKEIQIQLTGFLNKETAAFCKELWDLMLSAQDSPMGVPKELLEAKKRELQEEQLSKAAAEARLREQKEQDEMVESFRHHDRPDRPERGRGGGRSRGGDRRGRGDGGRHHHVESAMSMYLEVEAEVVDGEGVVIDLVSAVALHRAVLLQLRQLVAHAAHLHQIAPEPRPDGEYDGPPPLIAQSPHRDACDALHLEGPGLRGQDDVVDGETSHGRLVMTAEGYLGILRHLLPHQ
ncbi:Nn.00g057590.m01.CDS01 [Neocucurbitaria sp. VM-36]